MRIDAHQHFWKFDPVRDSWIGDNMLVLQADFLPPQLEPILKQYSFDACVAVQADQSEKETEFLLQLAQENKFIKGVVGWVDLKSERLEERLAYFSRFRKLKGFRHIVQAEPDEAFILRPAFTRGIALLQQYHFTYDILIYPKQLSAAEALASKFKDQKFVVDHLAKPYIKQGEVDNWKRDLRRLAQHPNVFCKISGMVTEGDLHHWKEDDLWPYLDAAVEAFGTHRLMYGSDWPVCLLAATYAQQLNIVQKYFKTFSKEEQAQVFGGNAQKFYSL
ncbi:MAG: amidohydrolase family protein [Chitinophagaceae bacterium]